MTEVFVFEQLEAPGGLVTTGDTAADRAAAVAAEAEARTRAIEEEARRLGYEAGRAEGRLSAEAEARSVLASLAEAAQAAAAAREEATRVLAEQAAELALLVAGRIVESALETRPELVREVVVSALRRVADADHLVLDVNPEDADSVRSHLAEAGDTRLRAIDVLPERRVPRGGCVVRAADVEIDARVAAQLERAAQLVREALRQS